MKDVKTFNRINKYEDISKIGRVFKDWQKDNDKDPTILPTSEDLVAFLNDMSLYDLDNIEEWLTKKLHINKIIVSSIKGMELSEYLYYLEIYDSPNLDVAKVEYLIDEVNKELFKLFQKLEQIIKDKRIKKGEINKLINERLSKESVIERKKIELEKEETKRLDELKTKLEKDNERLKNYKKYKKYLTDTEIKDSKRKTRSKANSKNYKTMIKDFEKDYEQYNKSQYSIDYILQDISAAHKGDRLSVFKYLDEGQDPRQLFSHRETSLDWVCINDSEHKWNTTIRKMFERKEVCLHCSGHYKREKKRASGLNTLDKIAPELEKEYHPSNKVPFNKITAGSAKMVSWICPINSKHIYETRVFSRATNGTGCPQCNPKGRSLNELIILFELMNFYKISKKQQSFSYKSDKKRKYFPDIVIPEVNLIVEYDGSYWHKDREKRDLEKNHYFEGLGYKVLRIREKPLSPLKKDDFVIDVKYKDRFKNKENLTELKKAVNYILVSYPPFQSADNYIKQKSLRSYSYAKEYYDKLGES
tara:strand:+ start:155 stop:1747 length:1593 start_codon:yes stop_codon:yes gene_type:complete